MRARPGIRRDGPPETEIPTGADAETRTKRSSPDIIGAARRSFRCIRWSDRNAPSGKRIRRKGNGAIAGNDRANTPPMQAGQPAAAGRSGRSGRSAQREALQSRSTIATFVQTILSMAKSGKKTFRESTADYAALAARIAERRFEPLYLLMGDEPYFIDSLTARLADAILPPDERAFNQTVVYGKDTDAGAVINLCRQMPMTGTRQVVIVRDAQSLRRLEQLSLYTASPCATTILVLCHKERNMDKRSQLYKQIAGRGVVFESVRPRDYEIAGWLAEYIRSRNCTIDAKSVSMLVDHLGADIAKIANEIDKLMTFLPEGTSRITAEHIEQNIGISKDFNNFELTRALSEKDMARALRIADHFARNPKENPLLVTLGTLFTHFQRIFIVNYQRWLCRRKGTPMPPDAELARMLKLSSAFFLKEYQQAASLYPNSRVFAIMGLIREYDLKSKGIDSGQATDGELLKELLLKIFVLR